jgi:ClpP class serine protease
MAASGAYWVASQANAIYATPNALVGSVGVYRAIVDRSKQAEQAGVEIKVVRSGDLKGTPVGEALSEQQLERQQAVVETMAARFFADVAARETISAEAMSEIKRGGIYAAEEAQRLGLIDGVQAFDATVAYSARKGATAMAASIKELKAAFKDDTEFVLECAEKELSLNEAKAAYAERLQAKLDAEKADHEKALAAAKAEAEEARAQAQEAEQKAQQAAAAGSGNQPVGGTAEDGNVGGDPVAEWNKLVEQATANCHTPLQRQQALGRVVARNPDLHKQYLAAQNGGQDHYSDFVAQSRRAAR